MIRRVLTELNSSYVYTDTEKAKMILSYMDLKLKGVSDKKKN